MIPDIIVKPANTSRASTTTLADDPDLVVALEANATYLVEMHIAAISGTTEDIKTAWTVPTGASGSKYVIGPGSASDGTDSSSNARWGGSAFVTSITYGARTGGFSFNFYEWAIVTTGVAGNVTFQWAQAVSGATAAQILINSYISARRLS
jgi:hypothetical protein